MHYADRMRDLTYPATILTAKTLFKMLGMSFQMTGTEHIPRQGGAILAANHVSYVDFVFDGLAAQPSGRLVRFMAKKDAFDHKISGPLMRSYHHISVDRANGQQSYDDAVRYAREGEIVGIFPEATISRSFEIKELKTGAVRMAAEAGVPVIPVAVWGGHRLMTKGPKTPLRAKFGLPVTFAVGEPMLVGEADDAAAVTLTLRERLQALVSALQDRYPDDGTGAWWQPADRGGSAPTPEVSAVEEAARKERKALARAARKR